MNLLARRDLLAFGTVLAVGIALTSAMTYRQCEAGIRAARTNAELRAAKANDALEGRIERAANAPESLAAFVEASGSVSSKSFAAFSQQLRKRFPEVLALEWAPKISSADIPEFEARFLKGAPVTAVQGDDLAPSSQNRVPIALVEPLEPNAMVLGMDLYSSAGRRKAIDEALSSGRTACTGPIGLIQRPGHKGLLVFAAVHLSDSSEGKFARGTVLGVYDVSTFFPEPTGSAEAGARLISATDVTDREPILVWQAADDPKGELVGKRLQFGNRLWRLNYRVASTDSNVQLSFILGALGALCSLLIAMKVRTYVRANTMLAERSEELRGVALDMMDELTSSKHKRSDL